MDENPSVELSISHETFYHYASRVVQAHHVGFLRPLEDEYQAVESFSLTILPKPRQRKEDHDQYGNARVFFSLDFPHSELKVCAKSTILVRPRFVGLDLDGGPSWEVVRDTLRYVAKEPWQAESEFVFPSPFVPIHAELREYALVSFTPDRPVLEASIDLMHRIHADFKYQSNATDVSTPLIEAFEERRGVCQDFAHILIGCVRSLGLAARYVSGYLLTNPPPGKPRLLGADASHAWVSVFCPHVTNNGGWVQLDPTNNVIPSTAHVTLAFGRDYGDVAPLRGVIRGGGEHKLAVAVSVIPVDEEPALILAAQRDAELAAKKAGGLDDANVVLAVQSTQSQAQTGSGQASPVLAPKLLDQG